MEFTIFFGLLNIVVGLIFIVFRVGVSKFLSIVMIRGIIRPKSYNPKEGNLGMILMGIFFVIVGLLLIFYPKIIYLTTQ